MKKIIGLCVAATLLLVGCGEKGTSPSIVGTPTTVGPVDFDEKEMAILTAVDQSEQNFIAYEMGTGETLVVKAYHYTDGGVYEQKVYMDKRIGILNAGFTWDGGELAFKLNGSTHHYGKKTQASYMAHRIAENMALTTKPTLIATYQATFKEDRALETTHENDTGKVYKKLDPSSISKDDVLIDIVAYVKKDN